MQKRVLPDNGTHGDIPAPRIKIDHVLTVEPDRPVDAVAKSFDCPHCRARVTALASAEWNGGDITSSVRLVRGDC